MNAGRAASRESSLSALCKPRGENVARWTIAREIGREGGRERKKRDKSGAEKGRRGPKKFSRPKESERFSKTDRAFRV